MKPATLAKHLRDLATVMPQDRDTLLAAADALIARAPGVGQTDMFAPRGFQPPGLEDVEMHAQKIGLPVVEAKRFVAYYTANGWKVGRNPMRDWRAAMVSWKLRYENDRSGFGRNGHAIERRNGFIAAGAPAPARGQVDAGGEAPWG